jgi:threonyl-tRNA synthetase
MSIIPISEKFNDYAEAIYKKLKGSGIRVKLDTRNEKMGAKIRNAELNKIPIMIILGEKEVENNSISIRRRFMGDQGSISVDSFLSESLDEINSRSKGPQKSND